MGNQIVENRLKDASYCPYCMPCPGLHRMAEKEPFLWVCQRCGAVEDARAEAAKVVGRGALAQEAAR